MTNKENKNKWEAQKLDIKMVGLTRVKSILYLI